MMRRDGLTGRRRRRRVASATACRGAAAVLWLCALPFLARTASIDRATLASAFCPGVGRRRSPPSKRGLPPPGDDGSTSLVDSRNYSRRAAEAKPRSNVDPPASEAAAFPRPEIGVRESRVNRRLDDDATITLAAKLDDGGCEGYLVEGPNNRFEAYLSCGEDELDGFAAVFHRLLLNYLAIERGLYEKEIRDGSSKRYGANLKVSMDEDSDGALMERLERIGIFSSQQGTSRGDDYSMGSEGLGIDLARYVPYANDFAFRHRGTDQGRESLRVLGMLADRRVPFDFDAHERKSNREISAGETSAPRRNVISRQKGLLPPSAINGAMEVMNEIKFRGWLSDNPDSVDGLPSLHLNLISNGKPMFEREEDGDGSVTFRRCISQMTEILCPHLYEDLLPKVRELTGSPTVEISDVFVRNYGKRTEGDGDGSDDGGKVPARFGLSAHYDVTAYATCVVAIDSTASTGRNGLYAIPPGTDRRASDHAALRRFFPLERGDGVIHTYDVLHGVDVDPELNRERTSLIIWFADAGGERDGESGTVDRPWLLDPVDDTGELVLGLASEAAGGEDGGRAALENSSDWAEMYLSSASKGNAFAMTRLARMCEDGLVDETRYEGVVSLLTKFARHNPFLSNMTREDRSRETPARALWYHAAVHGGHGAAQVSLADDLVLQYITRKEDMNESEHADLLLQAGTLFAMALVQGYDSRESVERLMGVECDRLDEMGVEVGGDDFFASPLVQTLTEYLRS